jgi:hypothetical protein
MREPPPWTSGNLPFMITKKTHLICYQKVGGDIVEKDAVHLEMEDGRPYLIMIACGNLTY